MTRYTPLWLQSGSYAASVDRRLPGALWPDARCDGMAVSVATGTTVNVAPGNASVPTANNTGSTLCVSDAVEQLALLVAPASGLTRNDLVIVRPRGTDLDGGVNNDWILDYVAGAEVASGAADPATPEGCLALASVTRPGGSAAIAPADIHDLRPGALAVPAGVPTSYPRGLVASGQGPAAALSGKVGTLWTWAPGVTVYAGRQYQLITSWQWTASAANSFEYFVYGLAPNDPAVGGRRFWWITQAIAATNTFYGDNVTGYAPGATGAFSVAYSNNGAAVNIPANGWRCWLYDVGGI